MRRIVLALLCRARRLRRLVGSGEAPHSSSPPPLVEDRADRPTGKVRPRPDAKFSFAGSHELAAQIEQGVKPDVFASANTKLPDALYAKKPRRSRSCSRRTGSCWQCRRAPPGHRPGRPPPRRTSSSRRRPEGVPGRRLHARGALPLPGDQASAILALVALRTSPTSPASSASSPSAPSMRASSTSPTSWPRRGGSRAIDLPAQPASPPSPRRGRRRGRTTPGPAQRFIDGLLRRPGARRSQGRVRAAAGPGGVRGRCSRARRRCSSFLMLPVVAIFVDIARASCSRASRPRRARGAVAEPRSARRRARDHRRGRDACGLPARTRRFRGRGVVVTLIELPLVLPPAVAGIGCSPRSARRGCSAALGPRPGPVADRRRRGRAHLRRRAVLHPPGAGGVRRGGARLVDASARSALRGADVRADRRCRTRRAAC